MNIVELHPVNDSRASFYGKAKVLIEENKKTLISYTTKVCYVENGQAFVLGQWGGRLQADILRNS